LKRTSLNVTSHLAAIYEAGVGSVVRMERPLLTEDAMAEIAAWKGADRDTLPLLRPLAAQMPLPWSRPLTATEEAS